MNARVFKYKIIIIIFNLNKKFLLRLKMQSLLISFYKYAVKRKQIEEDGKNLTYK